MTPEEFIESKIKKWGFVSEEDALEAVDMAKRDLAWKIHKLISETHDFAIIDKYVTDICDF
jgi:hypothetical protein